MDRPLTDQQLDEIATRAAHLYEHATTTVPNVQADFDQLAGTDTPALVAEVRRLRAELATERAQHEFTMRQRNNRGRRLLHLRDLAKAGDPNALTAAALDTLAASVNDHEPAVSSAVPRS